MLALSKSNCEVYGCHNSYKNTEKCVPPVRFYSFPKREWEKERAKVWVHFVKQRGYVKSYGTS